MIQARLFTWFIILRPTFTPMIITGVAMASAISAFGQIMVTLLIPVIGNPVFGSIVWEYFFPSIRIYFS
jgi:hypothetical protein